MKRARKTRKVDWKTRATNAEREIDRLDKLNTRLAAEAAAFTTLRDALVESMREEIQSMVEEAVQDLDIHIG